MLSNGEAPLGAHSGFRLPKPFLDLELQVFLVFVHKRNQVKPILARTETTWYLFVQEHQHKFRPLLFGVAAKQGKLTAECA